MGAQKAGTTWLQRELSRCSSVNLGFCKEYKAFPSIKPKAQTNRWRWPTPQPRFDPHRFAQLPEAEQHQWMRTDPWAYLHYFHTLVQGDPRLLATGDISPHYSELSAQQFQHIGRLLEKGGFNVKVILLLRDPVERVWSQLRMLRRQNRFPELCGYREEETALALLHHHPRFAAKTQYHRTLNQLERAFSPTQLHIDFYERLFTPDAHQRLAAFLELDLPEADFDTRVNASPKQIEICPKLQQTVALAYRNVYAAMVDRFGETVLDLWPHARWVTSQQPPTRPGLATTEPR
ncbi:sulfotransferase [Synechococcus sp. BS56D]|uniref:sulfotransferase n=1 Tax=Synechococcus sp. BS56D TaxID=2055944 RepID=UPI001F10A706|nr:sulfotransferase [Synechococcus sp. BS56D]